MIPIFACRAEAMSFGASGTALPSTFATAEQDFDGFRTSYPPSS